MHRQPLQITGLLALLIFVPGLSAAEPDVTLPGRWSAEKAQSWYGQHPWPVRCNFTPSTAINQLEMWQADTFDPETIDRELGWAADIGMNTIRVYLHDLLWQQNSEAFLKRIDQFLGIADKHGIKTMLVLCDAVWNPHPKLGKQPAPKPHLHNSGWVQSPHIEVLRDTAQKEEKCLALLKKMFTWAREVNPSQPLTTGLWSNEWIGQEATDLNRFIRENSDVISFHIYDHIEKTTDHPREKRHADTETLERSLRCLGILWTVVGPIWVPALASSPAIFTLPNVGQNSLIRWMA